jgi:uncharacterized protein YndB with AHSA1/START domain
MSDGPIQRDVTVPLRPDAAFRLFTEGLGDWLPGRPRLVPGADGALEEKRADGPARRWATVTAWEPGRRLALTWHHGHGEGEEPSEVVVTFLPVDHGTRVEVRHVALARLEAPGWAQVLGRLQAASSRSLSMGKVTLTL